MADLLFYLFGFGYFDYDEIAVYLLVWSNPNQSNKRSVVQRYKVSEYIQLPLNKIAQSGKIIAAENVTIFTHQTF